MDTPFLFSFQFFTYAFYFLVAVFLAVYIPGNLFTRRFKASFLETTTLSLILGIVFLTIQGLVFGYLQLRWLTYFYVFFTVVVWIWKNKNTKIKRPKISPDKLSILLIFFGVLGQLGGIWLMGARFPNGIHILGGQPPDNNLDLATISEIINRFPPYEPGMYGTFLQNYHYLSHLFTAELIRIFHLPLITASYQYLTIFLSILLGLSVISISNILNLGKVFTRWFLFFIYFGADLSFIILLFLGKGLNFNMMPLESGMEFLFNLPRAFSIIVLFGCVYLLISWVRRRDNLLGLIIGISLGTLIGFKVYTGIFVLLGLIPFTAYELYKKNYKVLLITITALIVSFLVYFPVNKNAGGLFFTGFWRADNFIALPTLGLSNLLLAKDVFQTHNNYFKVYLLEISFLILYLISTFGTKIFGIFQNKKTLSYVPKEINLFLLFAIFSSNIIGLFFWQKNGGPNTFNFIANSFIVLSFYAALSCFYFTDKLKKPIKYVFIFIVIALTIPRYFQIWAWNYDQQKHYELIDNYQLQTYNYIKNNTDPKSVVLASRNIGSDSIGPYINYLTDRSAYLAGEGNELESHGIDFKDRKRSVFLILNGKNIQNIKEELNKNPINYLILQNTNNFLFKNNTDVFKNVYENKQYTILKVK